MSLSGAQLSGGNSATARAENDFYATDPCCGSGSHCLVAKENNRKYIGIEINPEWYEKAKERF